MNRVLLTGRLTRDPEMRSLASGKTVTQFSVATNDYRGGEERPEYHNIVTWDRLAGISSGVGRRGAANEEGDEAEPGPKADGPRPRTANHRSRLAVFGRISSGVP